MTGDERAIKDLQIYVRSVGKFHSTKSTRMTYTNITYARWKARRLDQANHSSCLKMVPGEISLLGPSSATRHARIMDFQKKKQTLQLKSARA